MEDTNIHLVKAAFHAQFKIAMENCGVSADYYFKKVNLPIGVNDPESMLPLKPFFRLINIVAINENKPGFGSFVAQTTPWHKVLSLGPLIEASKSLNSLLETFCEVASSQSTLVNFTLDDRGLYSEFCYTDTPDYKGDVQMELYRITSMIELVQLSTGIHWRPEIIHLNMPENRAVDACSLFKKSEICFSQPISAISIECDLLQLPVHIEIPIREISHKSNAKIDTDFLSAIQQIVSSYTQTKIISVEEVAGIAELSVRSLQRRLRRNGVKFNDLLSQAKFVHAKSKLRETQIPIKEIARLLGYSDPAHFTRAFKSWSGSTPTDFRKSQH